MADTEQNIAIDRFPGSLEAVTWRKGTQDFGVTYAVPPEMRQYVKPLMDKINHYFVIACVKVSDSRQADYILRNQGEEIDTLPGNDGDDQGKWICGIDAISECFGMTPKGIQLYVQRGIIVKMGRGRYDLFKSAQNYLREVRTEQKSGGRRNEILTEKEDIQKERLLVKLLSEKKKLVNAEECVREVEKNNINVRNKLLQLPTKIAPLVVGIKRSAEVKEIIENYVFECLTELAGLDPSRVGTGEGKQDLCPATKVKRKRMGGRKKGSKLNKRRTG